MNTRMEISCAAYPCGTFLYACTIAILTALVIASPGRGNPSYLPAIDTGNQSGMFAKAVEVDLLDEMMARDGRYFVGIRMRLEDGWRTYWRVPGPSGVPTKMYITRSANVASSRMLWPAPSLIEQFGYTSIGYAGEIIFPIEIRTGTESIDHVLIDGYLSFGICKDVCIPVRTRIRIDLARLRISAHPGKLAMAIDSGPMTSIPVTRDMTVDCVEIEFANSTLRAFAFLPYGVRTSRVDAIVEDIHDRVFFGPSTIHPLDAGRLLVMSKVQWFKGTDTLIFPHELRLLLVYDDSAYEVPGCPLD